MGMMKRVAEARAITIYYIDDNASYYECYFKKSDNNTYTLVISGRRNGESRYFVDHEQTNLTYDDMINIANDICEANIIDRIVID